MSQISEKELGAISDQLAIEENLVAKYTHYASMTEDATLKSKYEQIASEQRTHCERLYAHLK